MITNHYNDRKTLQSFFSWRTDRSADSPDHRQTPKKSKIILTREQRYSWWWELCHAVCPIWKGCLYPYIGIFGSGIKVFVKCKSRKVQQVWRLHELWKKSPTMWYSKFQQNWAESSQWMWFMNQWGLSSTNMINCNCVKKIKNKILWNFGIVVLSVISQSSPSLWAALNHSAWVPVRLK